VARRTPSGGREPALAGLTVLVLVVLPRRETAISLFDGCALVLLAYLLACLIVTSIAFSPASDAAIRAWAERDSRGTVLERYVLGTAPGPGVSLFAAAVALAVAVVWLPGVADSRLPGGPRVGVAVALVVVAWACVLVSYVVTFYADYLVEDEQALQFPGRKSAHWADYVYFGVSIMTTFGTTDVNVTSRAMRQTVAVNAVIAFVFNTVTVATVVSALADTVWSRNSMEWQCRPSRKAGRAGA
jgi:uncharacterized membrane protein